MLTRKEFYDLAHECRDYALRLANHDQAVVSWKLCDEYNEFWRRVRSYDRLEAPLAGLRPARPITRGLILTIALLIWFLITVFGARFLSRLVWMMVISSSSMLVLVLLLIPPRVYGTSVEAIEGRVLVVVQALQQILESQEMQFTEAAYFVVRDVLREAAAELRQQVYLSRVAARK